MDPSIIAVFNNDIKPNEWHGVALRSHGMRGDHQLEYAVHWFKRDEIGQNYLGPAHDGTYTTDIRRAWAEFNRRVGLLLNREDITKNKPVPVEAAL